MSPQSEKLAWPMARPPRPHRHEGTLGEQNQSHEIHGSRTKEAFESQTPNCNSAVHFSGRHPRPTSQEIVDRLVDLISEKSYVTQKEMEIIGKLTFGKIKAKRQVAMTRTLIPCMVESYIQGSRSTASFDDYFDHSKESISHGGGSRIWSNSSGGSTTSSSRIRSLFFFAPKAPEEISNEDFARRTISPQQMLVFVKSLQACVVSNNLARTQCRNPHLYSTLLRDIRTVVMQIGRQSTLFNILEATLNLLCALCMNDGPNCRSLKLAMDRHPASLREYAGGSSELGQRVSFLQAVAHQ
jgi:hypothetical protein